MMKLTPRQKEYRTYFEGRKRIKNGPPRIKYKSLTCPLCGKSFGTYREVKEHKYDKHSY